ncbi:hypothetical protein LOK49_LG13G00874 [Camellia lanceoleosa]|uniref:Uncharacterized protein n=1 Tax=Camellia lanceoleosa TaxID=1840588 RepID=A0ACC0FKV3_9ERIC|nr:hypothetical protein LOK49_LG13G00874 [Camellia lanceoleosa]
MGDVPNSFTPPSAPPPHKSNMPVLYYGLVVVGTAAVVLAIYNLIIIKWCAEHYHQRRRRPEGLVRTLEPISSRSFDNPNIHLVGSFKYKKEQGGAQDQGLSVSGGAAGFEAARGGGSAGQFKRRAAGYNSHPCLNVFLLFF